MFPSTRLLLLGGTLVLLGACSDSAAPVAATLTAVSPTPAATGVAPTTTISMTFGQPMMAGMEQYVDLHDGDITGPTVPMTCGWNQAETTLTCAPTQSLDSLTTYTMHLGAGMTDAMGHRMSLADWTGRGGQWATGTMMGGGWTDGSHYGMLFPFTTH